MTGTISGGALLRSSARSARKPSPRSTLSFRFLLSSTLVIADGDARVRAKWNAGIGMTLALCGGLRYSSFVREVRFDCCRFTPHGSNPPSLFRFISFFEVVDDEHLRGQPVVRGDRGRHPFGLRGARGSLVRIDHHGQDDRTVEGFWIRGDARENSGPGRDQRP